ncbi:MAG: hypothetical protein IKO35_01200 [Elusimicrobiaceae bacterium]|nr:hypothetical protein [Elusimicrobiaceae bacterium]
MPTVPVYHQETPLEKAVVSTAKNTEQVQPSPLTEGTASDVRLQLAQTVRREMQEKGMLSADFLDKTALSHLPAESSNTPAGWDYAALRHAAHYQDQMAFRQQQAARLEQEAVWTEQVGVSTPDNASLQAYLEVQLPAYQNRLQQAGVAEDTAKQTVANLRTRTVQNHILRSLSDDDWKIAQQVLTGQGAVLPAGLYQQYATQIRRQFARSDARRLWQEASSVPGRNVQEIKSRALEKIQEPDEQLRAYIEQEIAVCAQEDHRAACAEQAALFERLAQSDTSHVHQLLDAQTALDVDAFETACRAASQLDKEASKEQKNWFTKHYFTASEKEIQEAFEKKRCSARDYFRLQAQYRRRESGQDTSREDWLCHAIGRWMHKQGFDEKEVARASYAVLTGAGEIEGRMQIWKDIKTLLTC